MQKPDITPEGSYTHGWETGAGIQNGWKAALAITLPIFTTHKAGVALEESTLAQITAERNATECALPPRSPPPWSSPRRNAQK